MDLKVLISGDEYWCTDKYRIAEQAGAVSISDFDVRLDGAAPPQSLSVLQALDADDNVFYSGIIQTVDHPTYSTQYETKIYHVQVASLNCVLNWRLISDAWVGKYAHEIVQDIYTNYLAEEGFTLGTVITSARYYEKYTANRMKIADVLAELGDPIGAVATISYSKVFSFIDGGSFQAATVPEKLTALSKSEDGSILRTVQYISGASENTSIQTKTFAWVSGQTEIALGYQVSSVIGASINGTPCGVGLQGLDDADTSKTFLWKYGQQNVSLNASALVKPTAGQTVSISYYGFYAVEVQSTNEALKTQIASLSGLSGKIEVSDVDSTITSLVDGEQAAQDLLQTNATRDEEINVTCHDLENSAPLMSWAINKPNLNIVGNYVVVERTISDFYDKFRIELKLKNQGFYSRYGTVYKKNDKTLKDLTIRPDDVVGKYSGVAETLTMQDAFAMDNAGMIYYPAGSDLIDPMPGYLEAYPV